MACTALHPVSRCDTVFEAPSVEDVLGAAVEHGGLTHGFTPAFYDQSRLESMTSAIVAAHR